ncbi:MAG: bifunctional nuclease family protein [Thermomicrobiales bacterium]|jgi:bifunctional DNase/RNase|nr:bifunctional nuclease family protein [Thermomicrobiales bacterium]
MIETVVHSIRVQMHSHHRLVILKELHGDRHLPIWIGDFEAQAIAIELQGVDSPRPLPYDVLKTVIGELGGSVDRVLVVDLSQDVYYARVVIATADRTVEIDSRPSDAIALAVRAGVPIFVDESVMERAGVTLENDDDVSDEPGMISSPERPEAVAGMSTDDERLSVFRDFINTLDLDDPDRRRGN